jgi:hypothetical protein
MIFGYMDDPDDLAAVVFMDWWKLCVDLLPSDL